jgi:hypothetical protein
MLPQFKQLHEAGACDLRIFENGVGIERTAEWCFNTVDTYIRQHTSNRCWVEKCEVWEHEKNSATVRYNVADLLPSRNDPKVTSESSTLTPEPPDQPAPVAEPIQESSGIHRPEGVPIRNPVTTGWSNPFKGTSWGV